MKKIIRSKKAVVLPLAIFVAVAIIVIAGVAVFVYSGESEPYYETETDFGMWQEEFYVVFDDGSEQSMKLIDGEKSNPEAFTVKYGAKTITSIGIRIYAKPTGSGYDGAELKFESFGVRRQIKLLSTVKKTYDSIRGDGTLKVVMQKNQQILSTSFNLNSEINDNPSKYPPGVYFASFESIGAVKYRGYPGEGNWKTASLPSTRTAMLMVTHTPTGSITVALSSEIYYS